MANYGNTLTFNGVSLKVLSMTPTKRQKTIKQIIGKSLNEINVIGLSGQQWELDINGMVLGTTSTNLGTNRAAIEALEDVTPHALVDGIHNGTYILVPGSLQFSDSGDDGGMKYNYSLKLVQE